jgi:hypothetical protein
VACKFSTLLPLYPLSLVHASCERPLPPRSPPTLYNFKFLPPYVISLRKIYHTVLRIIPLAFPDVSVFCFVFRTGLSFRSISLLAICQALSSFDVLHTFAPHLTIILLSRHAFSFPSAAVCSSF